MSRYQGLHRLAGNRGIHSTSSVMLQGHGSQIPHFRLRVTPVFKYIIDVTSNILIAQHVIYLAGGESVTYPIYPGFTVEAWIKRNIPPNSRGNVSRKWATIVVDGNTDYNRRDQSSTQFGQHEIRICTPKEIRRHDLCTINQKVNGNLYHVVGVYNQAPGTMSIYVNGRKAPDKGAVCTADSSGCGHHQIYTRLEKPWESSMIM